MPKLVCFKYNFNLCQNQKPVIFHPDIVFATSLIFKMENGGSTPVNTAEPFVQMFETIDEEVLLDDNALIKKK